MYWIISIAALLLAVFFLQWQWRKARYAGDVTQSAANILDWPQEARILAMPEPGLPDVQNNARLAIWAVAAYHGPGSQFLDALQDQVESEYGGNVMPWEYQNNAGLLIYWQRKMIIAVRGSYNARDWLVNSATYSQRATDWSDSTGIQLKSDSRLVRATTGGLGKTAECHAAIIETLIAHNLHSIVDVDTLYLTGHSLGGEVAYLLTITKEFGKGEVHTYNSPKILKVYSSRPYRRMVRTVNFLDGVTHVPISCRHPPSKRRIITPVGTRTYIPARYWGLSAVMIGAFVAMTCIVAPVNRLRALFKLPPWPFPTLGTSHSMESVYLYLRQFR